MKKKIDLFLDSGAFSAHSQKIEIDIYAYIDFIKEHIDQIEVYANLDVIGDAKATWENQRIMERAGLSPLPCFHLSDPDSYLTKYIEKYDYIALGGMAGQGVSSSQKRIFFLDKCWNAICDTPDRFPKVKVHGFGMTSLKLMLRYPWFSVDSTSWVVTGRMGQVFVPKIKGSEYIYDENSWKITVSSRSPAQKQAGEHIDTLSPHQKAKILEYFTHKGYSVGQSEFKTEKQGTYKLKKDERWSGKKKADGTRDVEMIIERGLGNEYKQRDKLNIIYFLDLEKSMQKWPWAFKIKKKGFGL